MKWVLLLLLLFIFGCSSDGNLEENNSLNITENVSLSPVINESVVNETENETIQNTNTCLDTDGGKTYNTKWTVVLEGKNYRTVSDHCDGGRLIEYYCEEDNALGTEVHFCSASVCLNGYCGEVNTTVTNETNSS